MDEEWGPWIEHDGRGCPCVGMWVECVIRDGRQYECRAGRTTLNASDNSPIPYRPGAPSRWVWAEVPSGRQIIRYRIRRPKAMRDLIDMMENLPVKEDA